MYSFPYSEPVSCSMSGSNCCFLNCIQISQEAGQVVWYSHLLKNFPQFVMIHTVKGFGIINKAEVDVMFFYLFTHQGFPDGSDSKESPCNGGDLGSIPGLGRSPGGGHGNPLQYSCLEHPHGQRSLVGYSPWGHRIGHNWVIKHSTLKIKPGSYS